jgi:hypothetical protein
MDTFRITQRGAGVVIVLDIDAADTYADKLAIADSVEDAVNDDENYDIYSDTGGVTMKHELTVLVQSALFWQDLAAKWLAKGNLDAVKKCERHAAERWQSIDNKMKGVVK